MHPSESENAEPDMNKESEQQSDKVGIGYQPSFMIFVFLMLLLPRHLVYPD